MKIDIYNETLKIIFLAGCESLKPRAGGASAREKLFILFFKIISRKKYER